MAITSDYSNQETVKSQIKTKGDNYSTGGKVGYGVGAGSSVEQQSSRSTGVTIDAQCGHITLVSASGSTTPASFTVTNATVKKEDGIVVWQYSGTDKYDITCTAVADGSFQISSRTMTGTTSEQPVFGFMVLKGALT